MIEDMEPMPQDLVDVRAYLAVREQCLLRAFIRHTTRDLIAFIESHHEFRAEADGSEARNHIAENISPDHLKKLGIPSKYWPLIQQVKSEKQTPYIRVGNKVRQRYKYEKRCRPWDESPRDFACVLLRHPLKNKHHHDYWAPLFPILYNKTVEDLEEEYIAYLKIWGIDYHRT